MSTTTSQMARTRTGGFPIGFRRGGDWQNALQALLPWAKENRMGVIDLGNDADTAGPLVQKSDLRLGSIDLLEWRGMISPDAAKRRDAVARNSAYIEACGVLGPVNYFVLMLPEDPSLPRTENFGYMADTYQQLAPVLEKHKARIVIEGWPGPGALCCTPEGYAAFFKACSSPVFGVNYDPSHLLRMGIDHLRFLREFAGRVYHVHGKDTELLDEGLYQYGNYQEATFGKPHGFGAMHWRYTIPGHGSVHWVDIFKILAETGYQGAVSIELEDENFMATPELQKAGILHGRDFLESV